MKKLRREMSKTKIRHVRWNADEWVAGVAVLSNAERGVYSTIVNLIYSHGGPIRIDLDEQSAWQVFGCSSAELRSHLQRLRHHDKIHQTRDKKTTVRRCEEVISETTAIIAKNRSAGLLGGRPSKETSELQKPNGFAMGNPEHNPNQEPITSNQKEEENPPCSPPLGDQQPEPPASSRPARKQDDRGTRLSPDWEPSAELWQFAIDSGLDPEATFGEFRDYWRAVPGAKARKLDWEATARNNVRHQAERRRNVVPISRAGRNSLLAFASGIQGD